MSDYFQQCLDVVLKQEGHYSNDEGDLGGATCWGITEQEWRANDYYGIIKDAPLDLATKIYRKEYWDTPTLNMSNCSSLIKAEVIFSEGINLGVGTIAIIIQKALGLNPDGKLGPISWAKINAMSDREFIYKTFEGCMIRYIDICVKKSTQLKFLKGWFNRLYSMLKMI